MTKFYGLFNLLIKWGLGIIPPIFLVQHLLGAILIVEGFETSYVVRFFIYLMIGSSLGYWLNMIHINFFEGQRVNVKINLDNINLCGDLTIKERDND